jgi:hypothetical protein
VQSKFLRYLYWKVNRLYPIDKSYTELLSHFSFDSLEDRRMLQGFAYLHRLINGLTDNSWLLSYINFYVPAVRFRCKRLFFIPRLYSNQHGNSPLYRICSKFNTILNQLNIFNCSFNSFTIQSKIIIRSLRDQQ